jgi:predicted metalloendopeptidase
MRMRRALATRRRARHRAKRWTHAASRLWAKVVGLSYVEERQ